MILAGPATTAAGPKDQAGVTQAWHAASGTAVSAYEAGDHALCAAACRQAAALSVKLPSGDPRCAASLNNLGIAALIAGSSNDALQSFTEACKAWRSARNWVAAMTLESPARSSLHHLRLERRHRNDYDALLRQGQLRLLTAARAVSLFNRLLCLAAMRDGPSSSQAIAMDRAVAQRLWALGPRNPEAAQLLDLQATLTRRENDAAATDAYRVRARQILENPGRRAGQFWAELDGTATDDLSKLKAAVHATLVTKPELHQS